MEIYVKIISIYSLFQFSVTNLSANFCHGQTLTDDVTNYSCGEYLVLTDNILDSKFDEKSGLDDRFSIRFNDNRE